MSDSGRYLVMRAPGGALGNQMFAFALARQYAEQFGFELVLEADWLGSRLFEGLDQIPVFDAPEYRRFESDRSFRGVRFRENAIWEEVGPGRTGLISRNTHRGLRGRVERGYWSGGPPYGYALVDELDGAAKLGSRLVREPAAAAVVLGLFEAYVAGASVRGLAHDLNARGVLAPRPRGGAKPRAWAISPVLALLGNEIYTGRAVWNKTEWVKDHDTGRRRRHERPEAAWVVTTDEAWRIVPDELFAAVGELRRARARDHLGADGRFIGSAVGVPSGRARHALSGLLACGACGGAFCVTHRPGVYACSWARDRGPTVCASALRPAVADVEERVLAALERVLVSDDFVLLDDAPPPDLDDRPRLEARLGALESELANVADAIARLGLRPALETKLAALEREQGTLREELAGLPPAPAGRTGPRPYVPAVVAVGLRACLRGDPAGVRALLAHLLGGERLRVYADAERGFAVRGTLRLPLGADGRVALPIGEGGEGWEGGAPDVVGTPPVAGERFPAKRTSCSGSRRECCPRREPRLNLQLQRGVSMARKIAGKTRRTELTALRTTPAEHALLRALALRQGKSLSMMLREILLDGPKASVRELERRAS
jgi:hypothetical protein